MRNLPEFETYKYDTYDLFLPSPSFSTNGIQRTVPVDSLVKEVVLVRNHWEGVFETFVEVQGDFIKVEETHYTGNDLTVTINLDTSSRNPGSSLKGKVIFTYLGGETVIPLEITIEDPSEGQETEEKPVYKEKVKASTGLIQPQIHPYIIDMGKKAYALDESARIRIINNQSYPLSVVVSEKDSHLKVDVPTLTVEDMGYINITYEKSWLQRMSRRFMQPKPYEDGQVTLTVRYDGGQDEVPIEIHYTSMGSNGLSGVTDDRAYKKHIMDAQRMYNRFILSDDRRKLLSAIELIEKAMAYHSTDVSLRIFYTLLLVEAHRLEAVEAQVNAVLKFSSYYLEGNMVEIVEIMDSLDSWLKQESVASRVSNWPVTGYRQLFRIRVFEKNRLNFDDLEMIYNQGFKSTHLIAHGAALMSARPIVPGRPSAFYRRLVTWAASKEAISRQWLDMIERQSYTLERHDHVNGMVASRLHALRNSESILKLLAMILVKEGATDIRAHAVYLESLRRGIFIKDLAYWYAKALCAGKLAPEWEVIQSSLTLAELSHDDKVYISLMYLQDDRTDKGPHNRMARWARSLADECAHGHVTDDEMALLNIRLQSHEALQEWVEIQDLLGKTGPSVWLHRMPEVISRLGSYGQGGLGWQWFLDHLPGDEFLGLLEDDMKAQVILWLIDHGKGDSLLYLERKGVIETLPLSIQITALGMPLDKDEPFTLTLAHRLYDTGHQQKEVLEVLASNGQMPFNQQMALYRKCSEQEVATKSFMEYLLYKGILTRYMPEQLLSVYMAYRLKEPEGEICLAMNSFYAAQVLIEDNYGYDQLIPLFEEELSGKGVNAKNMVPMGLALLRLYDLYGIENTVISRNLIKNAVRNGIIFPWFAAVAKPFMATEVLQRAVFFSYHSKPWLEVVLHYRADDQQAFISVPMKHAFMGFYTGYILGFYGESYEYYYEEKNSHRHSKHY